ncbi:hypothetical protein Kpol_1033p57 [Vanderwaltozyma polyspora DSM 70294]|uniref:SRP9 domain-containing protein n=1 Tax=Vanderwaltozyma polyspora (strain ATCC 22028 / DSM 70294 / BCRC 21397 / CBS 2163 / NBRC 10782 / NRRL Y-8283 / UCD 57-17) TaxID=436907 RepID=A7TJ51_VANPO|nr:uncharacterized protein Kpol_1033p57 [Vanderwaltozyma polyspora DSM 70294]EDO17750.1 hypothetical protein Kpol_1033p57 [Vanderwaltozyma polyspora DSM 70294]
MSIKPIDSYISNSVKLFEVNPSQTVFSLTYKFPKNSNNCTVKFNTHNSHLSSNYNFKTCKSKDVSRLLSAIGPRGVTVSMNKVNKKVKNSSNLKQYKVEKIGKTKNFTKIKDIVGISTLLTNTDVKEYVPQSIKNQSTNSNEQSSKSNKKNKNKNKNKSKKKR